MFHAKWMMLAFACLLALAACGDKKDSAQREQEAQKAIQEGMQKEKQMFEGMQKGVEELEKKAAEQTKKK